MPGEEALRALWPGPSLPGTWLPGLLPCPPRAAKMGAGAVRGAGLGWTLGSLARGQLGDPGPLLITLTPRTPPRDHVSTHGDRGPGRVCCPRVHRREGTRGARAAPGHAPGSSHAGRSLRPTELLNTALPATEQPARGPPSCADLEETPGAVGPLPSASPGPASTPSRYSPVHPPFPGSPPGSPAGETCPRPGEAGERQELSGKCPKG